MTLIQFAFEMNLPKTNPCYMGKTEKAKDGKNANAQKPPTINQPAFAASPRADLTWRATVASHCRRNCTDILKNDMVVNVKCFICGRHQAGPWAKIAFLAQEFHGVLPSCCAVVLDMRFTYLDRWCHHSKMLETKRKSISPASQCYYH